MQAPNLKWRKAMETAEEMERWWQEVEGKRRPRHKKKRPPPPRTPTPEPDAPRRRGPSGSDDGKDGGAPYPRRLPSEKVKSVQRVTCMS